jgi:hypothetical protein
MLTVSYLCPHQCQVVAEELIADFDSFPEGHKGYTITDGGITISDLDTYSLQPSYFYIDEVSPNLVPVQFSPPNVLATISYLPGTYTVGFGRFGSAKISFDGIATSASIDIFFSGQGESPNILTLKAFSNNIEVASDFMTFPFNSLVNQHDRLSISDVQFDGLQLVSSGPWQSGASLIIMDNIRITVPEPATLLLLTLGGLFLRKKR